MNIREANLTDLDSIEEIYNDIHLAEENGRQTSNKSFKKKR